MSKRQFVGLLKFFRNEDYMDQLIGGLVYCNTPEEYRLSGLEGVGDPHESCVHAFREARGDDEVVLKVNGKKLEGLTAVTVHMGGRKDMWLHCWTAFDMPQDDAELKRLTDDLNRIREQFGHDYVFLPSNKVRAFRERIEGLQDGAFDYGRVTYSEERNDWSVGCKSSSYSYQREYRFGFGQCKHTSTEPLKLVYEPGFDDLLMRNAALRITDKQNGAIWFHLDRDECYCQPDS